MRTAFALAAVVIGATPLALPPRHADATWTELHAPLFGPKGPSADDVFQGDTNDCTLLAHLAALAEQRPQVITAILHAGNLESRLAMPGGGVLTIPLTFPLEDSRFIFAGEAPPSFIAKGRRQSATKLQKPLWPMVIERAFATWHGGYAGLEKEILDPLNELLGWHQATLWTPKFGSEKALVVVTEAVKKGLVVVLGNGDPELAPAAGLRPGHAYAVLAARTDEQGRVQLTLRNPTGETQPPRTSNGRPGTFVMDGLEALRGLRYVSVSGEDLAGLELFLSK
jgi:hypothetical protein